MPAPVKRLGPPLGNTNAKRGARYRNLLIEVAEEYIANTGPDSDVQAQERRVRKVFRKLFELAGEGDVSAIKEINDRLLGKAPQAITIAGDEDGNPIQVTSIEVVFPTIASQVIESDEATPPLIGDASPS